MDAANVLAILPLLKKLSQFRHAASALHQDNDGDDEETETTCLCRHKKKTNTETTDYGFVVHPNTKERRNDNKEECNTCTHTHQANDARKHNAKLGKVCAWIMGSGQPTPWNYRARTYTIHTQPVNRSLSPGNDLLNVGNQQTVPFTGRFKFGRKLA